MRIPGLVMGASLAAVLAQADQLPFKVYGTSDGLPSTFVERITRDSRGLLWFATRDGLARFDGSRFVTYGTEVGLPVPSINHVLETRDGTYWVATNGSGVYRMPPDVPLLAAASAGATGLLAHRLGEGNAARVNVLHEDRAGRLWAGTDGGVFVLDRPRGDTGFRFVHLPDSGPPNAPLGIWAFVEDAEGGLWIGAAAGLFRRLPDGRFLHYPLAAPGRDGALRGLARDGQGRIWVAGYRGLLAFVPGAAADLPSGLTVVDALARAPETMGLASAVALPAHPGESRWYRPARLSPAAMSVYVTSDQHVWVGLVGGALAELEGGRWRIYTTDNGVPHDTVNAIIEDQDGNLWLAGRSVGVAKLTREGLHRFDDADGLPLAQVHSFHQDAGGSLFVVSGDWVLSRLDGSRFTTVRPQARWTKGAWASEAAWLDRSGRWWLLTGDGLGRLPRVRRLEDLAGRDLQVLYGPRDGLAHPVVTRLFEDLRGDLWASGRSSQASGLARWERSSGRWYGYSEKDGLPPGSVPGAFVEDAGGTLWIGLQQGGLMRYRQGRFALVPQAAITGAASAAYRDDAGDLWIGSSQDGLLRVVEATAEHPRFVHYTTAEGLASNNVRCITSDRLGRVYVGTVRGVDRLDPASGQVRHYTTGDGLANAFVTAAFRDRAGALWFGTMHGLSRLVPRPDRPQPPPRVWIGAVQVNGVRWPLSHLGQPSVGPLELGPDENQLRIEYFGLGFAAALRYQYRLEADREWSRPAEAREVEYARLAPGRYRFEVRAVEDGVASAEPARVAFTVFPPFWRRAWFQAALALGATLVAYALHRHRLAQVVALERVRTRIASDLHDDIGSSLSQIAILGEVARARLDGQAPELEQPLGLIARLSREAVDAMSDIVWAINPRHDRLPDLAQRMRRLASDLLAARSIAFGLDVADPGHGPRLGPDVRREVFLVFKEALNNAVRHSGCSRVDISLRVDGGWLLLEVGDDGHGLDPSRLGEGHGLLSMRQRAERLGGTVRWSPPPGTRVTLRVPVHAPARR